MIILFETIRQKEEIIMKRVAILPAIIIAIFFCLPAMIHGHCEIPCGIYNDEMRVEMISEHIQTIEKSMTAINGLEKAGLSHHSNQLVRWIMNKEEHANQLQEIVTQYFMTQRVRFDAKDYDKKLNILHHMLVYAMKCKQTTDLENIEALKKLVKEFKDVYFKK
jgi:nickel superoxide dismutase